MKQQVYLDNGWSVLDRAKIFCTNQAPLPIDPDVLIVNCRERWPTGTRFYPPDEGTIVFAEVFAPDGSFDISLFSDRLMIGLDGTPEQNVVTAAWLRSIMPRDAPRMIVTDGAVDTYAELPWGVTPEQIAASFVDTSAADFEYDPDMKQLLGLA